MFARLALAVLVFAVALGLDVVGLDLVADARHGLYASVAATFLVTALSGLAFRRGVEARLLAALQIPLDVVLVTALVHFSGDRDSLFTFLYALVTVYAAILFERRGAFLAASLSALGYGGILVATNAGWVQSFAARGTPEPLGVIGAVWGVYAGALYLVGALASVLSGELRRTGVALDQRTTDLERLRDLHRHTVESIMSGLLTTDEAGRITSFNPEAERITGARAGQAMGRRLETLIPGAPEMASSPRSRGRRGRLRYRNESGEELFLGLASSILRDADGRTLGTVLIFQDVTPVVAMEEELRRSERMAAVGELSAKIAHEIRNPLAAISGSIQILRGSLEGSQGDSERARLMGIVLRETERLDSLIGNFLRYARPRPVERRAVRLEPLVEEVAEMLRTSLPPDVELSCEVEPGTRVAADPDQLRQVLWNLCLNGVQAMAEGGQLSVQARRRATGPAQGASGGRRKGGEEGESPAQTRVEIAVRDTGAGMPPEVQERIFEPFFTTKKEGSGLGLATVHRIVEGHGGALQVESEAGKGTVCRLFLAPADEENAEEASA
jgi:two-component system sensor histidine kinase PilS (NtrC family)